MYENPSGSAHLRVYFPSGVQEHPLPTRPGNPFIIGRGNDAHLRFENAPPFAYISNRHCHILYEDGAYLIADGVPGGKPSSAGTFVNGQRIDAAYVRLTPGDRITLGNLEHALTMEFVAPKSGETATAYGLNPDVPNAPDFDEDTNPSNPAVTPPSQGSVVPPQQQEQQPAPYYQQQGSYYGQQQQAPPQQQGGFQPQGSYYPQPQPGNYQPQPGYFQTGTNPSNPWGAPPGYSYAPQPYRMPGAGGKAFLRIFLGIVAGIIGWSIAISGFALYLFEVDDPNMDVTRSVVVGMYALGTLITGIGLTWFQPSGNKLNVLLWTLGAAIIAGIGAFVIDEQYRDLSITFLVDYDTQEFVDFNLTVWFFRAAYAALAVIVLSTLNAICRQGPQEQRLTPLLMILGFAGFIGVSVLAAEFSEDLAEVFINDSFRLSESERRANVLISAVSVGFLYGGGVAAVLGILLNLGGRKPMYGPPPPQHQQPQPYPYPPNYYR